MCYRLYFGNLCETIVHSCRTIYLFVAMLPRHYIVRKGIATANCDALGPGFVSMSEHWANKQCMKIRRVGLLATEGVYLYLLHLCTNNNTDVSLIVLVKIMAVM